MEDGISGAPAPPEPLPAAAGDTPDACVGRSSVGGGPRCDSPGLAPALLSVVMFEKGTSTEYLIECSSCTTTLDTLRKESLRRWAPPWPEPAWPSALRTCNVLNNKGCFGVTRHSVSARQGSKTKGGAAKS